MNLEYLVIIWPLGVTVFMVEIFHRKCSKYTILHEKDAQWHSVISTVTCTWVQLFKAFSFMV